MWLCRSIANINDNGRGITAMPDERSKAAAPAKEPVRPATVRRQPLPNDYQSNLSKGI